MATSYLSQLLAMLRKQTKETNTTSQFILFVHIYRNAIIRTEVNKINRVPHETKKAGFSSTSPGKTRQIRRKFSEMTQCHITLMKWTQSKEKQTQWHSSSTWASAKSFGASRRMRTSTRNDKIKIKAVIKGHAIIGLRLKFNRCDFLLWDAAGHGHKNKQELSLEIIERFC